MSLVKWLVNTAGSDALAERNKVRCWPTTRDGDIETSHEWRALVQSGDTALHFAVNRGHLELVQWLVSTAGCDAPTQNQVRNPRRSRGRASSICCGLGCEAAEYCRASCFAGWRIGTSRRLSQRLSERRAVAGAFGGIERDSRTGCGAFADEPSIASLCARDVLTQLGLRCVVSARRHGSPGGVFPWATRRCGVAGVVGIRCENREKQCAF